jgi:hypothetical protein
VKTQLNEKIKARLAESKQIKISFSASANLQNLIKKYLEFYQENENEKPTQDVLISSLVESALLAQKPFKTWLKKSSQSVKE